MIFIFMVTLRKKNDRNLTNLEVPSEKLKEIRVKRAPETDLCHSKQCEELVIVKKKCLIKINECRTTIHQQYWKNGYEEKRSWIMSVTKVLPIKRKRERKPSGQEKTSYKYTFMNEDGYEEMVCQKFFEHPWCSSDKVLFNLFKHLGSVGDINSPPDRRGWHHTH